MRVAVSGSWAGSSAKQRDRNERRLRVEPFAAGDGVQNRPAIRGRLLLKSLRFVLRAHVVEHRGNVSQSAPAVGVRIERVHLLRDVARVVVLRQKAGLRLAAGENQLDRWPPQRLVGANRIGIAREPVEVREQLQLVARRRETAWPSDRTRAAA